MGARSYALVLTVFTAKGGGSIAGIVLVLAAILIPVGLALVRFW